ncbi:hypothetical protein ASD11_07645 [Aeromicrobium sp. Root495]|uniref:DUF3159 domain-containing protein n=1 Tax=Aeromicrobium sp. Root495 TaxID=1736550 RepID=UPI000700D38E|nr:DUF3159 domain-containing protein [Aeromicrobium sp. Root495]KQY59430.1 hypothetical protein ASD11_07645 [Aeromicrobium sp. Root495]RYJ07617.1 MAG: DUF3159 domain-containing protein [Actinomycetales bacterium]
MTSAPEPIDPGPQEHISSVEELVRRRLADALGGGRGILEAAVPTASFTITWLSTKDLRTSLILSISLTVVLLVVRLVQRSNPQFVLNALFGIAIAAVFAARSGEARDVFLPGILYNGAYAAVFIVSILVGWPVVGFLVGSLTGDPTAWHTNRQVVRLCSLLTWLFAAPCIVRVLVQYPLYASDQVGLLGTSKIVLGWPLQVAAFAAMGWVLGRNHTPLEDTRGL